MTRLLTLVLALFTVSSAMALEPKDLDCASPKSLILAPDREFYEKASVSGDISLDDLLAGTCRAFDEHHYTSREFALALHSLRQMLGEPRVASPQQSSNPATLLGRRDGEPLFLYIDVTCDHCRMAVEQVLEARKRERRFPSIDFRLLPGSSNAIAISGSAVLMALRQQQPENYVDAVILFSNILPGDSNALPALTAQYAPLDSDATTQARRSIKTAKRVWKQTPPFALYRGRILQRPVDFGFDDVPFDPFSDPELLILAVRLLDAAR